MPEKKTYLLELVCLNCKQESTKVMPRLFCPNCGSEKLVRKEC